MALPSPGVAVRAPAAPRATLPSGAGRPGRPYAGPARPLPTQSSWRWADRWADPTLKAAAAFWALVALAGQLLFAFYVASFYGGAVWQGHIALWNKVLPHGYVAGQPLGNAAVGAHLALAVLIIVGGAIQQLPAVRRLAPALHRWNGRLYLLNAVAISLIGLFMVWTRGAVGDLSQHLAISLNALLILLCAAVAWRHAVARRFGLHRRWALRLFLMVSGVWFFRVGLMFWLVLNQKPVGFDPATFQGPFLTFLAFGQTLIPLAVLEIYLRVQDGPSSAGRFVMAGGLVLLTLMMGVGIFGASLMMWLPHL